MKRTVIFLFCLITISSQAQVLNRVVTDDKGQKKLLGKTTKEGLQLAPFKDWYTKHYDAYLENTNVIDAIKSELNSSSIKVFFGSWCGDSKRELPRFYKVLDEANFPMDQLDLIAVDRTASAYKQAPNGEEKGLNIHRVPTFILYKDGEEVNRIVERPKESIERDLYNILITKKYSPNYNAVSYINSLFNEHSLTELTEMEATLIPRLAEYVKGSRELNTYGYVLLRSGDTDKALYIFDLNAKIFPYKHNVHDSLGEAFFETEAYTKALRAYYKVLSLHPESENAKEMIEKINTKLN